MKELLTAKPNTILADESMEVSATNLVPDQPAEISLECGPWQSSCTYSPDANGCISLQTDAPANGSYAGVDPMGLFWSMKAAPLSPTPMLIPTPDRLQLSVSQDGKVLDTTYIERIYAAPGVRRIEVRDHGLCGALYLPDGPGPYPGILSLGGSGGGLSESTAAAFASRGFAALALAFFNYSTLQSDLVEIPLEYFGTAIDWMKQHPEIDSERLAVRGVSRGGELSLLLGSIFSDLRAVIAMVPSSVRWGSISGVQERTNLAAWTHKGKSLAYNRRFTESVYTDTEAPISFTPDFLHSMNDSEMAIEAEIEVEKINGPILMVSGEDDAMWPATYFSNRVQERLADRGFTHQVIHESHKGAGHLIAGLPNQPTTAGPLMHPVIGKAVSIGGTPEADASATRSSWQAGLEFLQQKLM